MKRKKLTKKRKGRRKRFKRARDAADQLRQIESAQSRAREGTEPAIIDSIEKSRQRFRNALSNIRSLDDANEEFG